MASCFHDIISIAYIQRFTQSWCVDGNLGVGDGVWVLNINPPFLLTFPLFYPIFQHYRAPSSLAQHNFMPSSLER